MHTASHRNSPINLRALPSQRALIDRAAMLLGKSRSDFMLEAACREATDVLLDQRLFLLDEDQFQAFDKALSQPLDVGSQQRIGKLLQSVSPWER
ncbi:MAG: DUF1778 domain-containing protein [Thiothrix sp.]|nr:DUF1778 domain-containing protein [Thiothrix sp.]